MFDIAVFRLLATPRLKLLRSALVSSQARRTTTEILEPYHRRQCMTCNFKVISLANVVQSRQEGDSLIISVRPEDASQITKLHDYLFAGVNIRVARIEEPIALDSHAECDTPNTISTLKSVLDYRYTPDLRLLDLSDLGNDPLLKNIGIFDSQSRQSKFFPVLMTICDRLFDTAEAKVEAVTSVSLANNGLSTVGPVTTLAQTFPAIKNLDLSNNNLANLQGLDAWRWKFRSLEQLILSGNPLKVEAPNYVEEIIRWYPTLRTLDTIPVRSAEEAKPVSTTQLPLPIMVSSFRDEATVGENFIKEFFAAYDRDRTACINAFYDAKSTFSLSINTSAPRASNSQSTKAVGWDAVIKKSRNLIRVTQLPARLSRLYTGAQSISDAWATLPPSRHPDLLTEASKWCIECNAIPSLPDPVGQSVSGVGGLIIIVHGEFDEVNISTNETIITRSFDRTFILAPAGGVGGVRVACDTLILRSYGGSEAWKPQVGDFLVAHPAQPELLIQPLIPPGFGLAQPGKSDEQLQKECLAVELSKTTKMNLEFSGMCLQQSGWSLEAAAATFEAARVRFDTMLTMSFLCLMC